MELFQSMGKQIRFTILLAPFQPTIKIELEAYLSTTVECYLDIKNTSDKMLNVSRIYSLNRVCLIILYVRSYIICRQL